MSGLLIEILHCRVVSHTAGRDERVFMSTELGSVSII